MKVSILTLGCKVNQAESAFIEGNLLNRGYSIVPLSDQPNYCVINTCTVTAKSDYQSRQLIRRAVKAGAKVIVTGCYSQLRSEEIKEIEGPIDIVLNSYKHRIINMISDNSEGYCLGLSGRSRPYIKVQDGCNSACAYCIVPKARGRSRSMEVSEILDQILEIESQGYNEIVLTGIHLGSYGKDKKPYFKLSNLLESILLRSRIRRIRLSSIEVNEIDKELVDLLKEERMCKHIHIPLQSGDDMVLQRMNRKYRAIDYLKAIEYISSEVSGIAIGTDVIVGFPGEDDRGFRNTHKLLESLPMSYMHIFPFSPRPDIAASKMKDQISSSVKKERYETLNALNINKKNDYMRSQINQILDIIIEEQCDIDTMVGTSSNYLKIKVCATGLPKKTLVCVRAAGVEGNLIKGVLIEKL